MGYCTLSTRQSDDNRIRAPISMPFRGGSEPCSGRGSGHRADDCTDAPARRRQSPAVVPGRLVRVALFLPAAPVALPAARFLSSARGCTLAQTRSARPSFTSRSCGLGRGEREPDDRVVVVGTRHAILTAGSAGSDTGWGGRRSGMKRKWPGSCRVLPPLKSTSSVGMAPLPRRRRRGGRVLGF